MRGLKWWAAAVAAWACVHASAGEREMREAIAAEARAMFERGDYQALEERYAAALATSERTPSGVFVANKFRLGIVPGPAGESAAPGRDDYWIPQERKLEEWAARFPQSSLVAIVQSQVYVRHGWSWRGDGSARTVTPEGFQKLEAYAGRAHEVLKAREKAGRKDPYWYVEMLDVARAQGWPRDRKLTLMKEAMDAFPLNYDIYRSIAIQLTPRWGGSAASIASLAAHAVEKTREVEGETLYARVYWNVGDWLDAELAGPDVDWKRIRAGFDDMVERYPDSWNLNHYARYACDAKDTATARRVLLRIKGDVHPEAWPGREHYLRCVQAAGLKRGELE